jgi:hypothetical protein
VAPVATGRRGALLLLCAWLLAPAACERIRIDTLYALRLDAAPGRAAWDAALMLPLKAGGGNLNGPNRRLAELALDTDAVHVGSASCHHGPPITSPVRLQARASYTERDLHVELRWEDETADTRPRAWRKGPGGWALDDADEDGIAILWTRAAGGFGCQEACHMSDFALRQGELIDLRAMLMAEEGAWEEAWVWKPSRGAQALRLGHEGFRTVEGEVYRTVNSVAAVDPALRPEARRAGTFGPGDRPRDDGRGRAPDAAAVGAPAYLYSSGGSGGLTALAERTRGGWRVVFTRALEAGEGRQNFLPGERHRFGVAVFDATATNHHIVRDTQTLELVAQPVPARAAQDPPGVL